jgi:hypothetical protein
MDRAARVNALESMYEREAAVADRLCTDRDSCIAGIANARFFRAAFFASLL